MRQTVYALLINTMQSLVSSTPTDETDNPALVELFARAQEASMLVRFRLSRSPGGFELSAPDQAEYSTLGSVEEVARFLSEVLAAAAPSMG